MDTLVATWTNLGDVSWAQKTVSSCVSGQPIILLSSTTYSGGGMSIMIRATSGSNGLKTGGKTYTYGFGTTSQTDCGFHCGSMVVIPTASSVVFDIWDLDDDETIYVYRAG